MSYFYSLDEKEKKLKRSVSEGNLYNIDTRTIINNVIFSDVLILTYIIKKEENMRFDLVCKSIYGTNKYEEELMVFNNILNPYSVKEGQVIKYLPLAQIYYLHGFDPLKVNANNALVNKNKNTKIDPNRKANQGLPPTVKPSGLEQIQVDEINSIIRIINNMG